MQSIVALAREYEERLEDASRQISAYAEEIEALNNTWRVDVSNIPYKRRVLVRYTAVIPSSFSNGQSVDTAQTVTIAVRDVSGIVRRDNSAHIIPLSRITAWMPLPR